MTINLWKKKHTANGANRGQTDLCVCVWGWLTLYKLSKHYRVAVGLSTPQKLKKYGRDSNEKPDQKEQTTVSFYLHFFNKRANQPEGEEKLKLKHFMNELLTNAAVYGSTIQQYNYMTANNLCFHIIRKKVRQQHKLDFYLLGNQNHLTFNIVFSHYSKYCFSGRWLKHLPSWPTLLLICKITVFVN